MNTELLQLISIAAFVLTAIFWLTAVFLFFKLDVRSIIDDLSGKKAERQIRELREQNRTSEMSRNGRVLYNNVSSEKTTEKLPIGRTQPLTESTEEETTTLLEEKTTLLEENTTVLAEEETTVLDMTGILLPNGYRLLADVMIVHIEECI